MIEVIKKEDFSRQVLCEMKPNDSILVLHDSFVSCEATTSTCRMELRRHPRNDISKFKAEFNKENFTVQITALPN